MVAKFPRLVNIGSMHRWIRANLFHASQHARTSIGIAVGTHKAEIIHLALTQNLINTLFTNEETALALLKVAESS